jgi:hypothetical protein
MEADANAEFWPVALEKDPAEHGEQIASDDRAAPAHRHTRTRKPTCLALRVYALFDRVLLKIGRFKLSIGLAGFAALI